MSIPHGFVRNGRLGFIKSPLNWYTSRITAGRRALPDYVIIGSQKCGTSSLCTQLNQHPQVMPARTKEIHFFDAPDYSKGTAWYRAHFPLKSEMPDDVISGEASPFYIFHPHTPARMHELLPDVKLILMLRNPADRALSHFHHQVRHGREELTFEQAIDAEAERLEGERERILDDPEYYSYNFWAYSYLARGRYAEQIEHWLNWFSLEQMLIISSETYFAETQEQYLRTTDFLGLRQVPLENYLKANVGSYDKIEPALRSRLNEYFKPYNEALYALIGHDFGWQ